MGEDGAVSFLALFLWYNPTMNPKEIYVEQRRQRIDVAKVWRPSSEEISFMLNQIYSTVEDAATEYAGNEEQMKDLIQDYRQELQSKNGREASRLAVCSHATISLFAVATFKASWDGLREGKIPLFVLWTDATDGIYSAMEPIGIVEKVTTGEYETSVSASINFEEELDDAGLPTSIERYLLMQQRAVRIAQLFKEDSSGFKVIEDRVRQLRENNHSNGSIFVPEHQVPEFVLAGAETALRFYKAIYPFSEVKTF